MIRNLTRREAFTLAGAALLVSGRPGWALETSQALSHVEGTIDRILKLIVAHGSEAETAAGLRRLIEERAAVQAVARFAAGRSWRKMSPSQQNAFTDALIGAVSAEYARHFRRFEGEPEDLRKFVRILDATDAGRRGILVRTEILPVDELPVAIDWLVSDRSGSIAINDLVVEGISMVITQREVIAGMLEARNGNIEKMIADLRARGGG